VGTPHLAPSLSVKQLRVLFQAVQRLKKAWGGDVDVEFAFEGDAFYVLQCRALTGQRFRHEALHRIWDNSNIVESYSGVTTPLTFSFIKMAYAHVYRQFCELLGVDRRTIQRSRDLFDNMLGFIQGRVYYNLKNWYRLVSLLPAYTYNKEFMERMMGVSQSVTDSAPPASAYKRYFHTLPRLAWVGANIAVTMLTMRARMRRFFERFYRAYSRYSGLRFDSLTIAQLRAKREELERRVLLQWREPILNDLKAMIFVGVLARLTVRWAIDPRGHLQNRLLSGQGSLRSTEVVSQLFAVARRVRASDWSMQLFANQPAEDIMIALKTDPRLAEVAGAIEAYLQKYGVRCQEEMKLESVPMKDNPVQCISVLKHYIQIESGAPRHAPSSGGLLQKLRALGPFRRSVYLWVLRHARQAIRDRENQRFCRSEIYQVVRTLVRALGDRWAARGLLDDREDIFFLGIDEIDAYIDGTSLHSNLKELIAVRRREHERNKREELPSRFETWGEVYPNTAGLAYRPGAPPTAGELEGVPCYPGLAEGTAVVMREFDPGAQLRGEILVARHTDPGWVLLFPGISGLVVERGSVLSHSAILAREMGIPAIVGVPGATQRIRSGDRLRLDGFRGVIQVLSGTSTG
jgi:phosphohistidine swiveling domain-containing protein